MTDRPQLFYKQGDALIRELLDRCPNLEAPYVPPRLARNTHAQIALFMLHERMARPMEWEETQRISCPDGGTVALQWVGLEAATTETPTLVILPTITGNGDDLSGFIREVHEVLGWATVVCNRRGHLGVPLTAPNINTLGNADDFRRQLEAIEARRPSAPIYAVGLSAGSGLLVRYLGEEGSRARVKAGVAYSPGYDIHTAFNLTHPFYSFMITKRIKAYFLDRHIDMLGGVAGFDRLQRARNVQDFHDHLFALAGYPDRDAYYEGSNPMTVAPGIRVPMLVINAEDDPVCAIENVWLHGLPLVDHLPHCILAVTSRGSHCAFYESPAGLRSWGVTTITQYLEAAHALLTTAGAP